MREHGRTRTRNLLLVTVALATTIGAGTRRMGRMSYTLPYKEGEE